MTEPIALDVSLEKTRALHRVWRALNDGDCPNCHRLLSQEGIARTNGGIACKLCRFTISSAEISAIQKEFAPAMDSAMQIFHEWRTRRAADAGEVQYGFRSVKYVNAPNYGELLWRPDGSIVILSNFGNWAYKLKSSQGLPIKQYLQRITVEQLGAWILGDQYLVFSKAETVEAIDRSIKNWPTDEQPNEIFQLTRLSQGLISFDEWSQKTRLDAKWHRRNEVNQSWNSFVNEIWIKGLLPMLRDCK